MKQLLVMCLLLLSTQSLRAQETMEFDFSRNDISDKWSAGSLLVYDCVDMHWVCVTPGDHEECTRQREADLKTGKHKLACAPAGAYESIKECNMRATQLVSAGSYPRVCIHPLERGRFIGFR